MKNEMKASLPIEPTERDRERFRDSTKAMGFSLEYNRNERLGVYRDAITEMAWKIWWAQKLEKAEEELARLREQKPVAFWWIGEDGKDHGGPYRGVASHFAIDNARDSGCKPQLLYAYPVTSAPVVPEEWRDMLAWLIGQRGKGAHCHKRPGIWDDDNGELAGKPCHQCAMYDRARWLLQSINHLEQSIEKVVS